MPERVGPIFLVGFMGAGKTAVGAALAARLDWEFIDLDQLIVESERRSIDRIFDEDGEDCFRRLEVRALDSLRGRRRLVVACGGGTYAQPAGRERIDAMGIAIWIDVPFERALERCRAGPVRPLLNEASQAEALYRSRLPSYRAAPHRIEAAGLVPEEVAARVAALLPSLE
jgi:shikimate kinase